MISLCLAISALALALSMIDRRMQQRNRMAGWR